MLRFDMNRLRFLRSAFLGQQQTVTPAYLTHFQEYLRFNIHFSNRGRVADPEVHYNEEDKVNEGSEHSLFIQLMRKQSMAGCVATLSALSPTLQKSDLEEALTKLGKSNWRHADWVFKWMETCRNPRLRASGKDFSIILDILADAGQLQKVHGIFTFMKARGIPVTESHYAPILRAMCDRQQFARAEALLGKAIDEDEASSIDVWHALLKGYGDAGCIPDMFKLLKRMKDREIRLQPSTYTIMIGCLGEAGDLKKMERTFSEMQKEGIEADIAVLLSMAKAYRIAGESEKWESMFQRIEELEDVPDLAMTCMEKFSFYAQQGLFQELRNIIAESIMRDSQRRTTILNSAIQQYVVTERFSECLEIWGMFAAKGYKADKSTLLMLLNELAKQAGQSAKTEECLELLHEVDSHTGKVLKHLLLQGTGTEKIRKTEIKSWLLHLKSQGRAVEDNQLAAGITSEVFNVLLTSGKHKTALLLFKAVLACGIDYGHDFCGPTCWQLKVREFPLPVAQMLIVNWLYDVRKKWPAKSSPKEWRIETGNKREGFREAIVAELRELYLPVKVDLESPGSLRGTREELLLGMKENEHLLQAFALYGLPVE